MRLAIGWLTAIASQASAEATCQRWCRHSCYDLNGDVRFECSSCDDRFACRPGAPGFDDKPGKAKKLPSQKETIKRRPTDGNPRSGQASDWWRRKQYTDPEPPEWGARVNRWRQHGCPDFEIRDTLPTEEPDRPFLIRNWLNHSASTAFRRDLKARIASEGDALIDVGLFYTDRPEILNEVSGSSSSDRPPCGPDHACQASSIPSPRLTSPH